MALPLKRTLGELRSELSARLGFGAQGGSGVNQVLLNSFLQTAQDGLYWQYDFEELRKTTEDAAADNIVTGVGQTLYDYPDDCEPRRIIEVAVSYQETWQILKEGIDARHDSVAATQSYPLRFDRRQQLEIWPQPNGQYPLRIEYYQRPSRFTQDGDRATVDDGLVLLHALVSAKLHYRQPDAQVYSDQLTAMLGRLRRGAVGKKRFMRGSGYSEPVPRSEVSDA